MTETVRLAKRLASPRRPHQHERVGRAALGQRSKDKGLIEGSGAGGGGVLRIGITGSLDQALDQARRQAMIDKGIAQTVENRRGHATGKDLMDFFFVAAIINSRRDANAVTTGGPLSRDDNRIITQLSANERHRFSHRGRRVAF